MGRTASHGNNPLVVGGVRTVGDAAQLGVMSEVVPGGAVAATMRLLLRA